MILVVCQSEVADSIKSLFCLIGVSNYQTSALQCLNLLCQCHRLFGISHVYIQKMSRWVRCSYGKRAGFVDAKIDIISESSKFFELFCLFSPKKWFHKPCERLFYILFGDKAIQIPKNFVSLHRFLNRSGFAGLLPSGRKSAEAQGWSRMSWQEVMRIAGTQMVVSTIAKRIDGN